MVREKMVSVLLVDDDPHVGSIFELVMNHHQLPLAVVNDAEQAIDYLQNHVPSIIVVDLFLPGLDGYQLLREIRKIGLESHCRLVATTAYYTNDTQQEVLNRGFDGFLPKPFAAENLVPYLQSMMNPPA